MSDLKYLSAYPESVQQQVQSLINENKLGHFLLSKYPQSHTINSNKALYSYVNKLKSQFIKQSNPISKVLYDDKLDVLHQALGLHSYVARVQGNKLKAKNEIRIGTEFKQAPLEFLNMIAIHELAHIKEKQHNKAFYQLCCHMEPNYHQLEFETRVYLTYLEKFGALYE